MLIDSLGVLTKEAKRDGKNFPIYQEEDVEKVGEPLGYQKLRGKF